ncbi:hypothetical protein WDW89_00770 [Deltaproteobacteria bacterium TL4]
MLQKLLIGFSIKHPQLVMGLSGLVTLFFLAAFPNMTIDTDPVHMLPQDNPAIVLYEQMKEEFELYDMVVVGIHKSDGSSLFTVDGLTKIHQITKEILEIRVHPPQPSWQRDIFETLQFMREKNPDGDQSREIMVREDVMAPSEVDDIRLNESGELKVLPLMKDQ